MKMTSVAVVSVTAQRAAGASDTRSEVSVVERVTMPLTVGAGAARAQSDRWMLVIHAVDDGGGVSPTVRACSRGWRR